MSSSTAAAFGPVDAGDKGAGKKITAKNLPAPQFGNSQPVRKAEEEEPQPADSVREEEIPATPAVLSFGRALPAAKWIMILAGTASLIWFAAKILTREFAGESLTDSIDAGALCAALSSYAGAYIASAVRKAIRKLEEQRKE